MNSFDLSAQNWDENPIHWERSEAIARKIRQHIELKPSMNALEFGAGTGILSFLLKDSLREIIMMDNAQGMVEVMKEKVARKNAPGLIPLLHDLEHEAYKSLPFDLIFTQMALHHISNVPELLAKFFQMLLPGGYLAIADLYVEDGSFHNGNFSGHRGFDIGDLCDKLQQAGFREMTHEPCFIIKKELGNNKIKEFPVFILIAKK